VIAPSQKMLEEGDYNRTYRWHDDVLMIRGFSWWWAFVVVDRCATSVFPVESLVNWPLLEHMREGEIVRALIPRVN
jgi:hypothetical protein